RWWPRVPSGVRADLRAPQDPSQAHATAAPVDQRLRRTVAGHDPYRAMALCVPADLLPRAQADGQRPAGLPPLLQLRTPASWLSAQGTDAGDAVLSPPLSSQGPGCVAESTGPRWRRNLQTSSPNWTL